MSGGEGEGGKKAIWLITYCDMFTLLLVAFILILTMTSSGRDKYFPKTESLSSRLGLTGITDGKKEDVHRDAFVLRLMPPEGRKSPIGAELPPRWYSDPGGLLTGKVLEKLAFEKLGTLSDSHSFRLPLRQFFDDDRTVLSTSGTSLLQLLADRVRPLPYDIHVQVTSSIQIPKAVSICRYLNDLKKGGGIHPDRLAVSVNDLSPQGSDEIVFILVRQQD